MGLPMLPDMAVDDDKSTTITDLIPLVAPESVVGDRGAIFGRARPVVLTESQQVRLWDSDDPSALRGWSQPPRDPFPAVRRVRRRGRRGRGVSTRRRRGG